MVSKIQILNMTLQVTDSILALQDLSGATGVQPYYKNFHMHMAKRHIRHEYAATQIKCSMTLDIELA